MKHTQEPWTMNPSCFNDTPDNRDWGFEIRSDADSRKMVRWRTENPGKVQDSFCGVNVCDGGVQFNGSGDPHGPCDGIIDKDEVEANANHIVACVNGCANLNPAAVTKAVRAAELGLAFIVECNATNGGKFQALEDAVRGALEEVEPGMVGLALMALKHAAALEAAKKVTP